MNFYTTFDLDDTTRLKIVMNDSSQLSFNVGECSRIESTIPLNTYFEMSLEIYSKSGIRPLAPCIDIYDSSSEGDPFTKKYSSIKGYFTVLKNDLYDDTKGYYSVSEFLMKDFVFIDNTNNRIEIDSLLFYTEHMGQGG